MTRLLGIVSIWCSGLIFLFVGANIHEPYLTSLREVVTGALPVTRIVVLSVLIKRGYGNGRNIAEKLLAYCGVCHHCRYAAPKPHLRFASGISCSRTLRRRASWVNILWSVIRRSMRSC